MHKPNNGLRKRFKRFRRVKEVKNRQTRKRSDGFRLHHFKNGDGQYDRFFLRAEIVDDKYENALAQRVLARSPSQFGHPANQFALDQHRHALGLGFV